MSTPASYSRVPEKPTIDGVEDRWAQVWEEQGTYTFDATKTREQIYSIDTPPPTVSGSLHVGHVFSYTHTDCIARYQRMPKKEKMRLELDAWNEAFEADDKAPAAVAPAVEAILTADNVADDVVSALVNLKVPAKAAHAAVAEAQKTSAPEFEPLFQTALNIARKAA